MNSTPDRPPLLRFLLMFAILLTGATGLAALSHSVPADVDAPATATEGRVVPAPAAERARPADPAADARGALGQP
jgi:hypothetical protein